MFLKPPPPCRLRPGHQAQHFACAAEGLEILAQLASVAVLVELSALSGLTKEKGEPLADAAICGRKTEKAELEKALKEAGLLENELGKWQKRWSSTPASAAQSVASIQSRHHQSALQTHGALLRWAIAMGRVVVALVEIAGHMDGERLELNDLAGPLQQAMNFHGGLAPFQTKLHSLAQRLVDARSLHPAAAVSSLKVPISLPEGVLHIAGCGVVERFERQLERALRASANMRQEAKFYLLLKIFLLVGKGGGVALKVKVI